MIANMDFLNHRENLDGKKMFPHIKSYTMPVISCGIIIWPNWITNSSNVGLA